MRFLVPTGVVAKAAGRSGTWVTQRDHIFEPIRTSTGRRLYDPDFVEEKLKTLFPERAPHEKPRSVDQTPGAGPSERPPDARFYHE